MIVIIIVVAVVIAAVYLLRPLFTAALVVLVIAAVPAAAAPSAAAPLTAEPPTGASPARDLSIGLLLLAIEARRDHLRVSEALRISNPGGSRPLELTIPLPEDAQYLTFHRGLHRPVRTAAGFRARLWIPGGLSEIAYSYAVPSGSSATLVRSFPLPVARLEIVVRGRGAALRADPGRAADPLAVGGETLPRWEVSALAAGIPVTIALHHLPASQPWRPFAAAGGLALVLGSGLTVRVIRRRRNGEETSAV